MFRSLKELRNSKRTQKQTKTQTTFQTAVFHNKVTLCHIKPNIYTKKTEFASQAVLFLSSYL